MNIIISEQAKDYLKKKNICCLTLNMVCGGGGCSGGVAMPSVSYEEPADANKYEHNLIDNINVYISNSAKGQDIQLKFILRKFLFHEYVDVEGIRILR